MKVCTKCKLELPEGNFGVNNQNKSKLNARCRTCNNETARINRASGKVKRTPESRIERHRREPRYNMLQNAKNRAKRDDVPFDLVLEDIEIPSVCPVLGIKIYVGTSGCKANSPSLDKFIPELGYVRGNVHIISNRANFLKKDATTEEILLLASWMETTNR